jgi:hypothetical protein
LCVEHVFPVASDIMRLICGAVDLFFLQRPTAARQSRVPPRPPGDFAFKSDCFKNIFSNGPSNAIRSFG